MRKKRLILIGGFLTACICLPLGAVAVMPSEDRPGVTRTNLDRIEIGMTKAEVKDIFGEEGFELMGGYGSETVRLPIDGPRKMFVWFDADVGSARVWFEENRVVEAEWHDSNETVFTKIRRWLHLN